MRRTSLNASVTIVICPGVGRISIGYSATDIMRGMPYGTHATAPLAIGSPLAAASASALRFASNGAAYCGLNSIGVAGGGASGSTAAGPELVEGRPPRYGAQTPLRSTSADAVAAASAIASAATNVFTGALRSRRDHW